MDDDDLLDLLDAAAGAVAGALARTSEWGETGTVPGQHASDLTADRAALDVLAGSGLGVLSEESGWRGRDRPLAVVIDPVDGSTNASRRISWWATSLCVVDAEGPRVALVDDLVHRRRALAVRGRGARGLDLVPVAPDGAVPAPLPGAGWSDGRPLASSGCQDLEAGIVGLNGLPARHLGWAQCRALGAAALDLVAVASGHLDGFLDCSPDGLAPWDYLGALLVCREAGATVSALDDRPLEDLGEPHRRPVVAGATASLARTLAQRFAAVGSIPRFSTDDRDGASARSTRP